jgi:hypothetical protein
VAKKQYQYTLLKQDGTKTDLGVRLKMSLQDYYNVLGCDTIELVPKAYFKDGTNKRATAIVDEHYGLFIDPVDRVKYRNPFFKVLTDVNDNEWDVLGDVLLEQVYHGE